MIHKIINLKHGRLNIRILYMNSTIRSEGEVLEINTRCQAALVALYTDIEVFHFFSSPGSFPQERKARLDAGIVPETPDVNDTTQVFPSEMLDELSHNHFKGLSMKRIFCGHKLNIKEQIYLKWTKKVLKENLHARDGDDHFSPGDNHGKEMLTLDDNRYSQKCRRNRREILVLALILAGE
jgi:hypothetical protein